MPGEPQNNLVDFFTPSNAATVSVFEQLADPRLRNAAEYANRVVLLLGNTHFSVSLLVSFTRFVKPTGSTTIVTRLTILSRHFRNSFHPNDDALLHGRRSSARPAAGFWNRAGRRRTRR